MQADVSAVSLCAVLELNKNIFDKNTMVQKYVWKAIKEGCSMSIFDFLKLLLINVTNEQKSNIHVQADLKSECGMNDITGE